MSTNIPERAAEDWQALDSSHYLHPFTDFKQLAQQGSRSPTPSIDSYRNCLTTTAFSSAPIRRR